MGDAHRLSRRRVVDKVFGRHPTRDGRWWLVGRRYCPIVTMSRPMAARSASVPTTSVVGLAHADDDAGLVVESRSLRPGEHGEAAGIPGRWSDGPLQARHGLDVVVEDVGLGCEHHVERARITTTIGDQHLHRRGGFRRRIAAIVAAKAAAPPSARSSRATAVTTTCASPMRATASATRSGSSTSGGFGRRVSTRQKPHARVHALAVDHERRGAVGPALRQVRTASLLAHRREAEIAHRAPQLDDLTTKLERPRSQSGLRVAM